MSAGTDTDGAVVSWIVIVADFDTDVLSSVVVLHVTVVWPSGKCPVTLKSPTPCAGGAGRAATAPTSAATATPSRTSRRRPWRRPLIERWIVSPSLPRE